MLRFERELHDFLARNTEVLNSLRETNVLSDETVGRRSLRRSTRSSSSSRRVRASRSPRSGSEQFEAIAAEDVDQEKIVKGRR